MKATELMIGDWVKDKYKPKPHKVDSWADFNSAEDLSPIPLTSKILENNGFEFVEESKISISSEKLFDDHTSLRVRYCNGTCFVQLSHYGAGAYEFIKQIHYVHEFQHALHFCEINDLADNFKV